MVLDESLQDRTVGKGEGRGGGGRQRQHPLATHHFLEQKNVFHVKSENIRFLDVNNMRDFSLFIEQDISDKK